MSGTAFRMLLSVGAALAIVTGIVAFFSLGILLVPVGLALLALRICLEPGKAGDARERTRSTGVFP
ncbi:MAG TPA: hypothetical protein VND22_10130 [Actinomycetota bacterium]|nr:hypothetical protein [Actinomycetota bacterium]